LSSRYVVVIVNGSDRFFESMDRAVGVVFTLSSTFHFFGPSGMPVGEIWQSTPRSESLWRLLKSGFFASIFILNECTSCTAMALCNAKFCTVDVLNFSSPL